MSPLVITFAALGAALAIALLSVRTSALVTGAFLAREMLAVMALVDAGFWHPARSLGSVRPIRWRSAPWHWRGSAPRTLRAAAIKRWPSAKN